MRDGALIVAVAIKNNNSKTKGVVRWTLQQFASQEHVVFKLLHVQPRNSKSFSRQDSISNSIYKTDVDRKTREMLFPSRDMFVQREVQLDIMVLESDDVADAISKAVQDHEINELVIGASSCMVFSWMSKKTNLSTRISNVTPKFCSVHIISKGKVFNVRKSDIDIETSIADDRSFSSDSHTGSISSTSSHQFSTTPLLFQRIQALSTVNQKVGTKIETKNNDARHNRASSLDVEEAKIADPKGFYRTSSSSIGYGASDVSSWRSSPINQEASSSSVYSDPTSSTSQTNNDFELEKLKIELRHVRGMYAAAQSEVKDASKKMQDLNQRRHEEATRLKHLTIREEQVEEVFGIERERQEEAKNEAELVMECVEREAEERQDAENRAEDVRKEKERLEQALEGGPLQRQQYMKFTWEEIVEATSSFSPELQIGMGGYGTVYRCTLHHTTVAVKVLHSDKSSLTKQFDQELEILSKIRHPHLLLLLGACPDSGSLIYEYMHNGNLEERLLKLVPNDPERPPLKWSDRFRIAWEIASALYFLHSNEPRPIVHRDLKPANILLDRNNVSKIGDVGLSKMVNLDPSHASTVFNDTGPVGTFFYIDPEYQRTGMVSPESDVYAFGIILLQLATARSAMGLAHTVEKALRDQTGKFNDILDKTAGDWPVKEAKELVMIGLRCTEMHKRDRPDLGREILPVLERLKEVACNARNVLTENLIGNHQPPSHFLCPITKDVMENPCVASDGYTYEKKAIKKWLENNDKSPMTDLPFPNDSLLPNFSLLTAIKEWRDHN